MMVYVIDRRVPRAPRRSGLGSLVRASGNFEAEWVRVIRDLPGHQNAQVLFVAQNESFSDVCDRIVGVAGPAWSIYMLRIVAHGSPAYIELGRGVRHMQTSMFRRISHSMTPAHLNGRGLEIHGCNVAEGNRGAHFVQSISNTLALPVASSPQYQLADNGFQFEGQVSRVAPH